MQGSGACKRSLDGKTVLPPLWGVYYASCKERHTPAWVVVVVVVEYYCFLKRIIDVGAIRVADIPSGLFCIIITRGYSVRGVRVSLKSNFWRHSSTTPFNSPKWLGGDQISCPNSSGTISFGACTWILASQGRRFVAWQSKILHHRSLICAYCCLLSSLLYIFLKE